MFLLTLTVASLVIAAFMSVVAWRIAVMERRRSQARVDGLAAEIHAKAPNVQAVTYRQGEELDLRSPGSGTRAGTERELFGPVHSAPAPSRFATGLTIGVLVLAGALAGTVAFPAIARRAPLPDSGVAATPPSPLELVELGQERNGDSLTVRGVVRNPRSGARMDELTAVVFLFASDGGFITSGRAIVKSVSLGPGGESPFVVTVDGAQQVGRFRVSFRTDDRVVAHVDAREQELEVRSEK